MNAGSQATTTIISGAELLAAPQIDSPTVVNPFIPVGGITLLFGPPGVGKTAFAWALGNSMADGEEFLAHQTAQGKILFISLDMNRTLCQHRLQKTGVLAKFDFVFSDLPVDVLSRKFQSSWFHEKVQQRVQSGKYDLIVIDALGKLGRFDMAADNVPSQVYGSLNAWLPGQTFLIIHHSRKQKHDNSGQAIGKTMEDSFGSQFWTAYASSVVHLYKTNASIVRLVHCKSQVFELADPIDTYVDPVSSTLGLYDIQKVKTAIDRLSQWETKARAQNANFDQLTVEEKTKILMGISGKSRRTIFNLRKSVKKP